MIIATVLWWFTFIIGHGNVFIGFFVVGVLWIYGWWRARADPQFLTVYVVRLKYIKKTKGVRPYTGNYYHA